MKRRETDPASNQFPKPGIALQAMQEKKALSSRGRGRLRGFLELSTILSILRHGDQLVLG